MISALGPKRTSESYAKRTDMDLAFLARLTATIALLGCTPVGGGALDGRPTRAEIGRIEAELDLPAETEPLSAYSRFYAAHTENGRRVIIGEFVLGEPDWFLEHRTILETLSETVFVVDEINMPGVMDGGCGVLTMSYDPESSGMLGPVCNGVA